MATTLGRNTRTGLQVLGFAGLVVCAVLAIAILGGRAWTSSQVGHVFTTADQTIEEALATVDDAKARLQDRLAPLQAAITELGAAPAASLVPAAIAARLSTVADSYADGRDRIATARAQAQSAIRLATVASGVLPGFDVPPAISNAVTAIDDRVTQLDAAVQSLRTAAQTTAADAVAAAQRLRDAVTNAVDAATGVRTQVEGLRVKLVDVNGSLDAVLWISAGGALLFVAYLALLNALIVWLARRAPRVEAVPGDTPPPPEPAAA